VLEFLHRVIDVFEDFLGSPLLSGKIESHYDVVAQLLGEMCDGGIICNTESNALRENVEVSGGIGKLLTQVGLPGYGYFAAGMIILAHTAAHIGHRQL
jgi:AP-3 complex subunit mu